MIWNFSGMVLHTYLSIQVFSNKARLAQKNKKSATKNLLNEKTCTLKKKKHPRITPSFSNLFASILFLSFILFHFTPDVQRAMMTMMSMSSSYAPGGSPIHRSGICLLYRRISPLDISWTRWRISRGPVSDGDGRCLFPFWVP